jgi:hypothetical protein
LGRAQLHRKINTRILIFYIFSLICFQAIGILFFLKYQSVILGLVVGILAGIAAPICIGVIAVRLFMKIYQEKLSEDLSDGKA